MQLVEKCPTVGSRHERLEVRAAPSETGQTGEAGEMISSGFGVTEKAKDESHRALVKGWVVDAGRVGRRRHGQSSESRNLCMRHRDATSDAGRENRLPLEEARHNLLLRFDEARLDEELAEAPKELRPLANIWRNQHHCWVEVL
jgi:hypothetical protein